MPDVVVGIIGGKEEQLRSLRETYPSVRFFGTQPYRDIGNFQSMADVLVIPNDPQYREDQTYTSPIKLYAHLASGVPIVVTDLPTIRDVVTDETVNFFDGTSDSLVHEIAAIQHDTQSAHNKALQAQGLAREYTWTKRAERIIQYATGAQK
jgi:glycosyltransferase involved in cell wall biosynthesis